jgi:cellulose synthase/poly-beta-1,6-N-acetylglucosamine synthase-like glycosyltransferase
MKIAFLDTVGLTYNGNTLNEKGLGGSESAIIYLGQELTKLDINITVFNRCDKEGIYDNVRYIDISKVNENTEDFDIVIASRNVLPFVPIEQRDAVLSKFPEHDIANYKPLIDRSKYKVLWLHDNFVLGEEWLENTLVKGHYDEIFTLSDWHTQYIPNAMHGQELRHFEVMKRKMFQTRNGVKNFYNKTLDLGTYEDENGKTTSLKDKNLFIYNASTTKGMVPLLDTIWPRIHEEFPEAKLYIVGGYYSNNDPKKKTDKIEDIWIKKKKDHNGKRNVYFTGILTQKEIADLLVKASYFIYPGAFPETFGISATEALNYNVPLITTRFGALEETAPEATSYLIDYPITMGLKNYNTEGSVADPEQVEKFLDIVRIAYKADFLRKEKMYAANEFKPFLGWDTVALQWKRHFYYKLGLFLPLAETKETIYRTQRLHTLYKRRFFNEEDIIEDYSQFKKNDIVIITPVYNSEKYIANNILSVAAQMYDSYHQIIIDDLSTDNTYEVAKKTIESLPTELQNGFTLIKNTEKRHALGNQIHALKHIKGNPIIALLDGDDWLKNDPYIFEFINREHELGAKFTYGSFYSIADNMNCIAQPYPDHIHYNKSYRDHKFSWGIPYTHLRTFRKELFDNVDDSEFRDAEGNYWTYGGDNAMFYPLIEQCERYEIKAIQKILVIYNDMNPINDHKVNRSEQLETAKKIREATRDMKENKKVYTNFLNISTDDLQLIRETKDDKAIDKLKDILINRQDVWIDSDNVPQIRIRIEYIINKLANKDRNAKIFDIGSWTGTVANAIYNEGFHNITCFDIGEKVVELGMNSFPQFKWIQGDIEKYRTNEKFDIIIVAEILEHLKDPFAVIERLRNMLNENGEIIFTIPTEEYVFKDGSFEHISLFNEAILRDITNDVEVLDLAKLPKEYLARFSLQEENFKWYAGSIKKHKEIITEVEARAEHLNILIAVPTAKNIEVDTFKSIYYLDKPENANVDFQYFYGYRVDQVRNLIANYAILNKYDYVLFLDADMILPKDTLTRLLDYNGDIVSGIYIQRRIDKQVTEVHIDSGNVEDPAFFEGKDEINVNSTGFGCVLVRTSILEHVGYPQFEYHPSVEFSKTLSEDADFCIKARRLGYNVTILPKLSYGHIGSFKLELGKNPC